MPGFFLLLKSHIFTARSKKFLSFSCEDIGVAMVTNMISQLQESFPLRHAAGSFAVIEFFSSSLEFWLFWTENINIIVFISPL